MGALVIYDRNLLAICDWTTEDQFLLCLPVSKFVVGHVLPKAVSQVCSIKMLLIEINRKSREIIMKNHLFN